MKIPEATAVNRTHRLALFDDDVTRPFANMLDGDGDETDNPDAAVIVVVPVHDKWMVLDLRDFELVRAA